jgi:hypothetical protein
LIFGVRDRRDANGQRTGIPEAAGGLAANSDQELRRLDGILRSGLDPKLPGVRMKSVAGFPKGPVIVVRIPKSWASPHMVRVGKSTRFYSRNSTGKHQLDAREIRAQVIE